MARFGFDKPIPSEAWVGITSGGNDDKPRWSADGTLYLVSDRDGFRCIWGQRIDPRSLTLTGQVFPAYHSHRARRSMKDLPFNVFSLSVSAGQLFFIQPEHTGNIWLIEPAN